MRFSEVSPSVVSKRAITGVRVLPPPRRLGQPLWDTNTPFEVTEKIAAPQGLGRPGARLRDRRDDRVAIPHPAGLPGVEHLRAVRRHARHRPADVETDVSSSGIPGVHGRLARLPGRDYNRQT